MNKIYIVTGDNCTACTKLKNILKRNQIKFTEVDVVKDKERTEGLRSIPQAYKGYDLDELLFTGCPSEKDVLRLVKRRT